MYNVYNKLKRKIRNGENVKKKLQADKAIRFVR